MRGSGYFAVVLLAAIVGAVREGSAAEGHIPVEKFAEIPAAMSARMSPDGTKVALISSYHGHQVLYVHAIVEGGKNSKIIGLGDYQVRWVRWKDNQRLVAGVFATTSQLFAYNAPGQFEVTRLVAFDSDGGNMTLIGEPPGGFIQRYENVSGSVNGHPVVHPQMQDDVVSMLPHSPGKILQSVIDKVPYEGRPNPPSVYTVDLDSGRHNLFDHGDDRIQHYLIDSSDSLRLGTGIKELDEIVYFRSTSAEKWQEIFRRRANSKEVFEPVAFLKDDPQMLYVLTNMAPEGKSGLWLFDCGKAQFARPVDDQAGVEQQPFVRQGVLAGYGRKDGSYLYLDPAWQSDYQSVRKAVGGKAVSIIDRTDDGSRVMLEMYEPHHPKVWWVLDRTVKPANLWPAIEAYPDFPEEGVAPVREVSYKARDGLKIPAYLTLPLGYREGPIPFIVLPHGGPYVCEGSEFDYESQFLASRGWGVLRPQFRGTSCYGADFESKGFREWGLAMQDDVTDGTRWLIEQKYADPSRICIVGGSYGGYAALEGAEKEPDLYRCAAAWAPVTDLLDFRRGIKDLINGQVALDRLGDDEGRLDAASPARHADRIKVPVLLVHGLSDFTVNKAQSQIMETALRRSGKQVETIYLDNADHYREQYEARFAWLSALDRFLSVQLNEPRGVSATH